MPEDNGIAGFVSGSGEVVISIDDLMKTLEWMREGLIRQNNYTKRKAINVIFEMLVTNMNDLKIEILAGELHKEVSGEEPPLTLPPSIVDYLAKQKPPGPTSGPPSDPSNIDPFD